MAQGDLKGRFEITCAHPALERQLPKQKNRLATTLTILRIDGQSEINSRRKS